MRIGVLHRETKQKSAPPGATKPPLILRQGLKPVGPRPWARSHATKARSAKPIRPHHHKRFAEKCRQCFSRLEKSRQTFSNSVTLLTLAARPSFRMPLWARSIRLITFCRACPPGFLLPFFPTLSLTRHTCGSGYCGCFCLSASRVFNSAH